VATLVWALCPCGWVVELERLLEAPQVQVQVQVQRELVKRLV
jgi:hypothetical protein